MTDQPQAPEPAATAPLSRRLPVSLLYLQSPALADHPWDPIARTISDHVPGIRTGGRQLFLCVPDPPTSMLFDLAVDAALAIRELEPEVPALRDLRILVLPGEIERTNGQTELTDDLVVKEFLEQPTLPVDPGVFLTSRAALGLEWSWITDDAGKYTCRSGPVLPLLEIKGRSGVPRQHFRNHELLGRPVGFVPRPRLAAKIDAALASGAVRIVGPLGSGKSRLVRETLKNRSGHLIRSTPGDPARSIAERLLRQLLEVTANPSSSAVLTKLDEVDGDRRRARAGSYLLQLAQAHGKNRPEAITVLVDDTERAHEHDLSLLRQIAGAGLPPDRFALVLVGRSGGSWMASTATLETVRVDDMDETSMRILAEAVCDPLDMPERVTERMIEAASGSPFAFEEGLLELLHARSLRRIYGSFFFGGPSTTEFIPSRRYVLHVLTEANRLGNPHAMLALATTERAVPADALVSVNRIDSLSPYLEAGWIEATDSPWGQAVRLGSPAIASALQRSLVPATARRLRREVGARLVERSNDTASRWAAVQLLAGSDLAARQLIAVMRPMPPESVRDQIYKAFAQELASLRDRGGEVGLELDLLWAMLPLARRLGRIHEASTSLDRALDLAQSDPPRWIAFATLKAELDIEEGRPREAEIHLKKALKIAVEQGNRKRSLLAIQLARLLIQQERMAEARHLLEHLESEASEHGGEAMVATCRFYLGNIAMHEGEYDEALVLHRRSLTERQRLKLVSAIGSSLCAIGATSLRMGNYPEALEAYQEADAHLVEYGRPGERSYALLGIGRVLARLGQPTSATRPLRQALEQRIGHDTSIGEAIARLEVADNYLELDLVDDAIDEIRRARFHLNMVDEHPVRGDAEQILGRALLKQRKVDEARVHLEKALELHMRHKKPRQAIRDLGWLLVDAQARGIRSEVEVLVRRLADALDRGPYPARGELDDFRLFAALEWLEKLGGATPVPPIKHLRRAYRELMRKTSYLDAEQRSPYLSQIAEHAEIVEAATRHRLSLPTFL